WDDKGDEHDRMHDELLDRYQVYGSLIAGTKFKIVECRSGGRPFRDEEPEPVHAPPQPGDEQVGDWSHAQLVRMHNRFRARLLRAFKRGKEKRQAAAATSSRH